MNLWAVNMRRTSRNVLSSRIVLEEAPARRKSWEPCEVSFAWLLAVEPRLPAPCDCDPGVELPDNGCPDNEFRRLSGPRELEEWIVEDDLPTGASTGPRRNSGRPKTLWSIGQTGRTYCFRVWWNGVSVFRSPHTCLNSDDKSLRSGPKAVLL